LALAKMILNEKNPKSDELKYAIARLEQIINDLDVSETSVVRIRSSAGYILGKAFLQGDGVLKDIQKALKYLTDSAELGNQYAQFTLGKLYLLGKDVSKDKIRAEKWLSKSAEQGNTYAKFFLDNIDRFIEPSVMYYLVQVLNHVSKIFESNLKQQMTSGTLQVDSKRLRKLKEKKIAQGHKADEQGLEL
jgi:TPR repeat protein